MTIVEAMRDAACRLAPTSDTPRLDAEILMAFAVGVTRSELLIHHMHGEAPAKFEAMVARRHLCEPVAYIVGATEFFGRSFSVSRDVLIPRSDSETVVEAMLDQMHGTVSGAVLDLGVGSGALLLTLLAERSGLRGVGADRSQAALDVAQRNADALHLSDRCELLRWDWNASQDGLDWLTSLGSFDFVIANPPYVETDAELEPSVSNFEPHSALFAGKDGLNDYRVIIPMLRSLGAKVCVLEIGSMQAKAVAALAGAHGFAAKVRNDIANRPRAVVLHA